MRVVNIVQPGLYVVDEFNTSSGVASREMGTLLRVMQRPLGDMRPEKVEPYATISCDSRYILINVLTYLNHVLVVDLSESSG